MFTKPQLWKLYLWLLVIIAVSLVGIFFQPVISAMAVIIAAVITCVIIRRIDKSLGLIESAARQISQGDLEVNLPHRSIKELRPFVRTLNSMTAKLYERLNTLDARQKELEAVFSSMAEGVIVVDSNEKIVSINDTASRMFNTDPTRAQNQLVRTVIWNPALDDMVVRVLHRQDSLEQEIVIFTDSKRYVQARATSLKRDGKSFVVLVLNDVSRLKNLENLRRDFVANVSHELKTPITSIKGFVETLREGAIDDPESARRFLEIITKQADRLSAIIDDLLSLSRIEQETENRQIAIETGKLKDVIDSAVLACSAKAQAKQMKVLVNCDESLFARINAQLLEQALVNLIDNAIKYSDPDKEIQINAERSGSQVQIKVIDHGFGISHEHLPRIFERFYVIDKARSRKLGGTGLGLAIVKHIAAAHGGTVNVDSTPGKGSTFTISIPSE
jgi:two-component system phosphate regulon sensor histidine kinase PhoR